MIRMCFSDFLVDRFEFFSGVRIFLKFYFAKRRPPSCRRRRDDQNASFPGSTDQNFLIFELFSVFAILGMVYLLVGYAIRW